MRRRAPEGQPELDGVGCRLELDGVGSRPELDGADCRHELDGVAPRPELDEEHRALLRLRLLPGLGDRRLAALLTRFGSAGRVLAAPASELGAAPAAARSDAELEVRMQKAEEAIRRLGVRLLGATDRLYPAALRELHDPPPLLFARGRVELLDRVAVAVVGSRRHTEYGADAADLLASGLAAAGVVVVSGLARGIDARAHAAALRAGTIGVLGAGIDRPYPLENRKLFDAIAADGLLLSEFPPGEPPLRHNFPRRNRIIAALARGVVVIEAGPGSGSLITVEHALDLGREIFAVPGPIGRETSVGTHTLIRDGATLVTSAADVLASLGIEAAIERAVGAASDARDGCSTRGGASAAAPLSQPAGTTTAAPSPAVASSDPLWRALTVEPLHIDVLAARAGLAPAAAAAGLLAMEVGGLAKRMSGMRFRRS